MNTDQPGTYLQYLPGIYHQTPPGKKTNFVGQFLKVFEKILSGIDDDVKAEDATGGEQEIIGIEEILENIHDYFDPLFTPGPSAAEPDFVSYLADWVGLTLRQNWPEDKKRRLIAEIVPLYKKRGTREGLTHILQIFVGEHVIIEDVLPEIQVGINSWILKGGLRLGGYKPHFFVVNIMIESFNLDFLRNIEKNIRAIIDLEKPAHTYYALSYRFPGIQVGIRQRSEVGQTTLIFGS